MLLAIDVGNTHTVYGLWDGAKWVSHWRLQTDPDATEDALAASLKVLFELQGVPFQIQGAVCASVVPSVEWTLARLCEKWFSVPLRFLLNGGQVGLEVSYQPPTAVGADRIANAVAALERFAPPILIVDFGTATTFDAIDAEGMYRGGAILPGLVVSAQALVGRTAKLPQVEFVAPESAVGTTTPHALQSGLMFGYAGAIDGLARRMQAELGEGCSVIATGGLGKAFVGLCETLSQYEPTLTLDGLILAYPKL